MIDIPVRVHRVSRERLADRTVAHVAHLHIDGSLQTSSVRLTPDVFERIDAAHAAGRRFVMTLSVVVPTPDGDS